MIRKFLASLFVVLVLCAVAYGQGMQPTGDATVKHSVVAGEDCASGVAKLLCQNMEGTGYDNGETWSEYPTGDCVINEDYTTTVLRGSQSAYMATTSGDGCWLYHSFTAGSPRYAFARVRPVSLPSSYWSNPLMLFDSTPATDLVNFNVYSDGTTAIYHGAESASCTTLSAGTTYFMWIEYTKGTGTDGIVNMYIATTGTKPASPTCSVTSGTATADAGYLISNSSHDAFIIDQIMVSTSQMGDVAN